MCIRDRHKAALLGNSSCELAAVCDITAEQAGQLAEGTNARVYTDYREMQEAEQLDAVILNLPHYLHKEVSVFFLEHHIAVLVEKPMANTTEAVSYTHLDVYKRQVKGGLVRDRENLPLDMIKNLCYMSLPSYIMDSSPWTLPQFRNGIVHFFVASNVTR